MRSALNARRVVPTIAAVIVVGAVALWASLSASGAPGSDPATSPRAVAYSSGDYIEPLSAADVQVPVTDGMAITVTDEYGNQTPAQIRDGAVWATGDTVPTSQEGADALGVAWSPGP